MFRIKEQRLLYYSQQLPIYLPVSIKIRSDSFNSTFFFELFQAACDGFSAHAQPLCQLLHGISGVFFQQEKNCSLVFSHPISHPISHPVGNLDDSIFRRSELDHDVSGVDGVFRLRNSVIFASRTYLLYSTSPAFYKSSQIKDMRNIWVIWAGCMFAHQVLKRTVFRETSAIKCTQSQGQK